MSVFHTRETLGRDVGERSVVVECTDVLGTSTRDSQCPPSPPPVPYDPFV